MKDAYAGRRVLVTGGLGFIGSNLAHRLVELGAEVTLIDSLIPEYGGNRFNIAGLEDRVHVNISDVRDVHSMRALVRGADYLFNLAGQTSHVDSMEDPFTDLEINARASLSVLETCRQLNPGINITFASTRQIYGKPEYVPVDENHRLRPADINGVHKVAAEWYHTLYHEVHGIRSQALRFTNTIGPRMRVRDARQTFVGIWIRLLVEGRPFEVWGGEQVRDFTYVDDAVEALLLVAANGSTEGQVFNVGGDPGVTLRKLADMLVEVNGGGEYRVCSYPDSRKSIEIGDYVANDGLLRGEVGWAPRVSLREGLKRTIEYYHRHLQEYV